MEIPFKIKLLPEQKRGEWLFKGNAKYDAWSEFECSECGNIILATARDFNLHLFDYCSKCGAKMERRSDEHNT